MSLVGAVVAPHPPIIVPEVGRGRIDQVEDTVAAMRRLGEEAARLQPETIVLLSPHGPLSTQRMGVILAESYQGSLAQFGVPEVSLELEGDLPLAEGILRESMDGGVAAQGMRPSDGAAELDHGSLVPLYFLTERLDYSPRLVSLTFSFLGPAAHLDFGGAAGRAVEAHDTRVLFVASGDLSHRLTADAPAGFDPRGREFDDRVVRALKAGSQDGLVAIPQELTEAAGECGYRSLLVFFGLLTGRTFEVEVLSYEGPFGVGYLVAQALIGSTDRETPEEVDR